MKIVCELGINHQGNPDTAEEMIVAAADAGCDAVKLQTYRTKDFLPEGHEDYDMFESCEIWPHLSRLVEFAHDGGMEIGTTPTSHHGIAEAADAGVDFLKNGSDFLLRRDLIEAMLDTGIETWASTGMATPEEIENAPNGANLMLCTSLYPCPDENAHLVRLRTEFFRGYSDHTQSLLTAAVCSTLGAQMYETHFTLNRNLPGPDHAFSRDPDAMTLIVQHVRNAEALLGDYVYPDPAELANRDKWRVTKDTLRS